MFYRKRSEHFICLSAMCNEPSQRSVCLKLCRAKMRFLHSGVTITAFNCYKHFPVSSTQSALQSSRDRELCICLQVLPINSYTILETRLICC